MWFKELAAGDLSVVYYRFKWVPFGMRFSPNLLMKALYIYLILCVAVSDQDEIQVRQMLYNLSYMDNLHAVLRMRIKWSGRMNLRKVFSLVTNSISNSMLLIVQS